MARFRIYHRVLNAAPETVDAIIKATTCLHNFIKQQKSDASFYCGQGFVDREVGGVISAGQWRREVPQNVGIGGIGAIRFGNRGYGREAFNVRNHLKDYLNNIGSVSWQREHIRKT